MWHVHRTALLVCGLAVSGAGSCSADVIMRRDYPVAEQTVTTREMIITQRTYRVAPRRRVGSNCGRQYRRGSDLADMRHEVARDLRSAGVDGGHIAVEMRKFDLGTCNLR